MKTGWPLLVLCLAACSSEEAASPTTTDAGADVALVPDASSCSEPVGPDAAVPKPTPADIQFTSVNPLLPGEQILFNDWNLSPNPLFSIRADGSGESEVFRAYRIWSLGAANDGRMLAFSCGDPNQEQNYGINVGDAIQHTWLYDVAAASASVLTWGNLNDECHHFAADNSALWVCRRANFTATGTSDGYRIAKLSLPCGATELPTSPSATELELSPRPSADGTTLYYTLIQIAAGKQTRSIVRKALPEGAPEPIRQSATLLQLSPDGTRMLLSDHSQTGALYTLRLDGSEPVKVASHSSTNAVYSPDGSRVAYLWDETQTCHHIEVVAADGSQADTPTRLRDCGSAFITELVWLNVP